MLTRYKSNPIKYIEQNKKHDQLKRSSSEIYESDEEFDDDDDDLTIRKIKNNRKRRRIGNYELTPIDESIWNYPIHTSFVFIKQKIIKSRLEMSFMNKNKIDSLTIVPVRFMTRRCLYHEEMTKEDIFIVAKDVCQLFHIKSGSCAKHLMHFNSHEKFRALVISTPTECGRSKQVSSAISLNHTFQNSLSKQILTLLTHQGLDRLLNSTKGKHTLSTVSDWIRQTMDHILANQNSLKQSSIQHKNIVNDFEKQYNYKSLSNYLNNLDSLPLTIQAEFVADSQTPNPLQCNHEDDNEADEAEQEDGDFTDDDTEEDNHQDEIQPNCEQITNLDNLLLAMDSKEEFHPKRKVLLANDISTLIRDGSHISHIKPLSFFNSAKNENHKIRVVGLENKLSGELTFYVHATDIGSLIERTSNISRLFGKFSTPYEKVIFPIVGSHNYERGQSSNALTVQGVEKFLQCKRMLDQPLEFKKQITQWVQKNIIQHMKRPTLDFFL
jgi:hypothetical protein